MTLIIADNIDDRLDFRGYLRKNGILAAAPPPSDFEAAVMSGKSEVIIFHLPLQTVTRGGRTARQNMYCRRHGRIVKQFIYARV